MMPSLIASPIMVVVWGGGTRWDSTKENLGIKLRPCSQPMQSLGPPRLSPITQDAQRIHLTTQKEWNP